MDKPFILQPSGMVRYGDWSLTRIKAYEKSIEDWVYYPTPENYEIVTTTWSFLTEEEQKPYTEGKRAILVSEAMAKKRARTTTFIKLDDDNYLYKDNLLRLSDFKGVDRTEIFERKSRGFWREESLDQVSNTVLAALLVKALRRIESLELSLELASWESMGEDL